MLDAIQRLCPICRDAEIQLEPYRFGGLSIKPSPMAMGEDYLETEIYLCPRCRYAALFVPPSPAEEFERRNGSLICRELLGLGEGVKFVPPSDRSAEYYKKRPCPRLCACAAGILAHYLETHPDPAADRTAQDEDNIGATP